MLLNAITQQAHGIQDNLSLLPLGQETIAATLKLVNQTGDYARTLADTIGAGGIITASDWKQLNMLSEGLTAFSLKLNDLLVRFSEGESIFSATDFEPDKDTAQINDIEPAVDYPVLLYDGPFSEGRDTATYAGLIGEPVDVTEAETILRSFVQNGTGKSAQCIPVGESTIPVECWEFAVTSGEYIMSAGVTKIGGHVLYMLPENDVAEKRLAKDECIEKGLAFLLNEGFGSMTLSYYRAFDGILTVNYAAMQDDVVLYPDLIKLQISMKDGAIIGMEASNYYANHIAREIAEPALDVSDATNRINDALSIKSARLCIIPLDIGEALCYEFSANKGEEGYLVYIDAITGLEREIMQLVDSGDGIIAQ